MKSALKVQLRLRLSTFHLEMKAVSAPVAHQRNEADRYLRAVGSFHFDVGQFQLQRSKKHVLLVAGHVDEIGFRISMQQVHVDSESGHIDGIRSIHRPRLEEANHLTLRFIVRYVHWFIDESFMQSF